MMMMMMTIIIIIIYSCSAGSPKQYRSHWPAFLIHYSTRKVPAALHTAVCITAAQTFGSYKLQFGCFFCCNVRCGLYRPDCVVDRVQLLYSCQIFFDVSIFLLSLLLRVILKLIFKKWNVEPWNGWIWIRIAIGSGHFFVLVLLSLFLYCTVSACVVRAATLTEVFPCFFLSCKANARV